jgi:LuxR family maltose regulon positive regulatory protein
MTDTFAAADLGRSLPAAAHGLIERRELVAALDRAVERKVTVVTAPAGSGKSSLLRAWADQAAPHHRIAFVSVRPGQQEPQSFWLALLAAVRSAAGLAREHAAPAATPGFNAPAMVEKVLAEIGAADGPIAVIIDDLHELAFPEAAEQLAELLAGLPAHARVIVGTRRDLPLNLHRLRLAGELSEIRAEQLRFTEEETRRLLRNAGIDLADGVAALLHRRAEGWAAGLRLAALSLAGHPDPERFVAEFTGSERTVAEYLMAEMLERQPAGVQRMLLRTCVLDQVNGELADLLTGEAGAERILLALEDANAFVISLDPGRTWFRYHHLFGGLLRLELRRRHADQIPDLHRLAAAWYARHGQPAEAVAHRQAAGDWNEAARLLTDHALSLTLDGRVATMAALLRAFPAGSGVGFPALALAHAITDLDRMRLLDAQANLEIARAHAATTAPDRRYRLETACTSVQLLLARLRGHLDGVYKQAEGLTAPAADLSGTDVAIGRDLRAVALMNLGITEAWSLRLADAERHLLEGAALARDIGRPYLEVACRAHLGFASVGRSLALARQRCEQAIALATRHGWEAEAVIAPAQANLAGVLTWTGEFDRAQTWVDRAASAAGAPGEPGTRLLIHLVAGNLHAARGRNQAALAQFTAAGRVQEGMAGEHALITRVSGWAIATQARLGHPDRARATLARCEERHLSCGEIRNAVAVICLAEHDPEAARRALRPVLDGAAPVKHQLTVVEAYLLDALACRDLSDRQAARAAVEQALDLAEPDRLIMPFAMTGAWELLETLPPHGTSHAALITDILDAVHGGRRSAADHSTASSAAPAEELSPSELRVLRYLPTNLTRPEIAAELSISVNTINTHIRRIYTKLGATDRSAAVHRGRELRLLSTGRT